MVWQDSAYFQGQVLQDDWFEHLRDVVGLDWVLRGEKKVGRDPDRLEPEEYKLKQEREKLEQDKLRLKEEQAKAAADLATTLDWVERGVKNPVGLHRPGARGHIRHSPHARRYA